MRAAFVLHLYYPELASELVEAVAHLDTELDVIATAPAPVAPAVRAALDRLPGRVELVETPNRGWDVGPLFAVLPLLRTRGYDVVCKLHTKQGGSGYAAEWRDICLEALVGSDDLVKRSLAAFAERPGLALVGPRSLYKSAAATMFGNAETVEPLARALAEPDLPPSDWGYFAGSMFWARTSLIERLVPLAEFDVEDARRDGTRAHALERLFGLAPALDEGEIGLVDEGGLEVVTAPGSPSHEAVQQTLVARAEATAGIIDQALSDRIARDNPLVHYIRHGRDPDALDPNPYFSSLWYNTVNADVHAAGMHPLGHYIHHGAFEDRSTGPLFDMGFYLARNPEVRAAGLDPLRHFLEVGSPAGLPATAAPQGGHDAQEARPRRFYPSFDLAREKAFLAGLSPAPDTLVSIVMPVFNRGDRVGDAIRSVLAQGHRRWELLVVDDGSTDGSAEAVAPCLADPRVRLIRAVHAGVSAARNIGLEQARGELVAYLDADNRWKPWFLEVMAAHLARTGAEAGYSGIEVCDDRAQLAGYRGDDWDFDAALTLNYVDLNAFVHRRALSDELGGFDPHLRRMVDWDLILRYGRDRPLAYAPFAGCVYHDGKFDRGRITVREPAAFRRVVEAKHRTGAVAGSRALARAVPLTFAIKVAAPEAEKAAWGDFHFAESLAAALERLGFRAHIDFRDRWHVRPVSEEDVAIVLRGLIPYEPPQGQIVLLWIISHPDQVGFEEIDRATCAFVASCSMAEWLRPLTGTPVTALLQATDPERFHPVDPAPAGAPVLFVGNTRGVDRDIVRWAVEAGRPPVIYGGGWDSRVPDGLVAAEAIDNLELGALYAGAGVVLNDHWPSMRAFGILSNRLFDAVASGAQAVSDPVPSLAALFGHTVTQVASAGETGRAIDRLLDRPRPPEARARDAARIAASHSFDARTRVLVEAAYAALGLPSPIDAVPAQPAGDARLRVHVLAPHGPAGPQSSAFIRLHGPLTDDSVAHRIALSIGAEGEPLPACDIVLVQRTALASVAAADALVRAAGERGAALVTDVDDAFVAMEDHPEAAQYGPRAAALERAMAAAAECWFSTAPLRDLYAHVAARTHIAPNALDPRLWRDWRRPHRELFEGGRTRMLYMGTHTHAEDFALVRPALERLADDGRAFDLTLIGVAPDVAPAPWLRHLSPPADAIAYPRFVRWLRSQGPFDVGLAPLADTAFNRAKSDIKLLDYAALGLSPLVSSGPAYTADPRAAELAMLVGDGEDAWTDALRTVLDDPEAHRGRAAALEAHLWNRRTVREVAPGLADRLERLARS